ncbi:PPE domain-containing protein [Streptomyces pseudoechinosporeus]
MATLTYKDVAEVDLGKLGTAVADWEKAVDDLKKLASSAENRMLARSEAARWAGVNATVTRDFVKQVTKEFTDAHAQAQTIFRLINDAHQDLVEIQRKMKTALQEADALGLRIEDLGGGQVRWFFPHVRGDSDERTQEQLTSAQSVADRVASLTANAMEIDASVTGALSKAHGKDPANFGHKNYDSLDDAQSERAVELAKRGPEMTGKELTELNRLMKYNAKDSDFSTAFYQGLGGPKQALEFFGQMSIDSVYVDEKGRQAMTQELQRNLGTALASATDPDNKTHLQASWANEFRKLGTERIPMTKYDQNPPYGYQLLGGIMRYGEYDARFLNPIAEHVVQLHQKDPMMFADSKFAIGTGDQHPFNPSGKNGAGFDPVTGMLEALGHSPEAAKEFFTADPKSYAEDGTLKNEAPDLGKGKDGQPITNYLDYFANDKYQMFPDIVGHAPDDAEKAFTYVNDSFGHALEAATLGHAYDDSTPQLVRDEKSAQIMEQVVETYGGDAELLKKQEVLSDSLGRMGAGYIDDINWALNENTSDSIFAPTRNYDGHAEFGRDGARDFLTALGQHPGAYAEVSAAEKVYTTSVLSAQVSEDGTINEPASREVVRTGAHVQGMLDQSRADQVTAENIKKDEDYNKALEERAGWIELGVGVGVAAGAAFLPPVAAVGVAATLIPVAMDAGPEVVEQVLGNVIGDWAESQQQDSGEDSQKQRDAIYHAGEYNAEVPMKEFILRNGINRDNSDFGQDLEEAWHSGYDSGTARATQQGQHPQTGE